MFIRRIFPGLLALLIAFAVLPATAQIVGKEKREIEDIVRQYILENPEIITEAITRLRQRERVARAKAQQRARDENKARIYNNPLTPVIGNPNGDVTVVEFFDYQCPYCKRVFPILKKVIANDKNLRVLMKELPILGPASRFAARAATAAKKQGKYIVYHTALMEIRGGVTEKKVMRMAATVGLDIKKLVKDMADPAINLYLDRTLALARSLGINGTPGFLFGDKLVLGAIDEARMRELIAGVRKPKG